MLTPRSPVALKLSPDSFKTTRLYRGGAESESDILSSRLRECVIGGKSLAGGGC